MDTAVINENNLRKESTSKEGHKPATFEEVVTLLGFGKFDYLLFFLCTIGMFCSQFELMPASYIFNSARCDLHLSLQDMGYLNSASYGGMIASAMIWGFLTDTIGRRKIIIAGFFVDAALVFISAISQNFMTLFLTKFFGGLIISGPFAAMSSYISEFLSSQYRPRAQLYYGCMICMGLTVLPLLAWGILSLELDFELFGGAIELHAWNFFLFICGIPALVSGIIFIFLPESPKFLMSIGKNEKALEIFKKIYAMNTGQHADHFPIKALVDETKNQDNTYGATITSNRTRSQALKEGFQQIKPLFCPPLLSKLILVCLIESFVLQSMNTIRLWTPQIFQAVQDYDVSGNDTKGGLCAMIKSLQDSPVVDDVCTTKKDYSSVYINSIIVFSIAMIGYVFTGTIINILGKKNTLIIFCAVAAVASFSLYFAPNAIITVFLITTFTATLNICSMVVLGVAVDFFPTTLRTLTLSLTMMVARISAMIGSLIFPVLLTMGCAPPFFYAGGLSAAAVLLSFLLPNTDNKALL